MDGNGGLQSIGRFLAARIRTVRATGRLWATLALALFLVIRVLDPSIMQLVRVKSFDLLQTLKPSSNTRRPVVIVDIDEASLKAVGQWPWPRSVLAQLVTRLRNAGVPAIAFDVIFAERDRTSPAVYAGTAGDLPAAVRDALKKLPSHDTLFADAMKSSRVVLGMALLAKPAAGAKAAPRKLSIAHIGPNPRDLLVSAPGLLRNIPELEAAATGLGLITNFPEFDGVVRRVPLLYKIGARTYPALSVELIRAATGQQTIVVRSGADGVEALVLAGVAVPTDRHGRVWVNFSPHDPNRYVSAKDVLAGRVPKARLQGRLVLVGTSAQGLLDIKSTPITRAIPGVEVHAQLIENILFKDHVNRPAFATAIEVLLTAQIVLLLIIILPRLGAVRTLFAGVVGMALMTAGTWFMFAEEGLFFDLTFPVGATFGIYAFLAWFNYVREERSKRQVRSAFSHYLAPALVEQLAEHPESLTLGGEVRQLTLLFSDIRGFSGISENLTAEQLTGLINAYMTPMTDVILAHKGTIDKYIGDAIMAFWNAPLDDPDHSRNGCRAALGMIEALKKFNAARLANGEGGEPIRIGVGVNTGPCCVGNMGSEQRFDYSAIGDEVNVGSRIESLTKTYAVPIIIGGNAARAVPDMAILQIDEVAVRGRSGLTKLFALLGDERYAATPAFKAWRAAHEALVGRLGTAPADEIADAIAHCRELSDGRLDTAYGLMAERASETHPAPGGAPAPQPAGAA